MITKEEKIEIILNKIDNLEKVMESYVKYADDLKDKYSLEDVLLDCNTIKQSLLGEMEALISAPLD
jgi:hypothetical protein